MSAYLVLDVTIAGRRHNDVRIHGAGGLLPNHPESVERLRHRMERGETVRVYTLWTASESEHVDVPARDLAIVKVHGRARGAS